MTIELMEACGSVLPYKIEMSVYNPSTLKAQLAEMTLFMQTTDGSNLVSINIPAFEVLPGNNTYNWQSTLTVDDEQALVPILQSFFNSQVQTLTLAYTLTVTALGMTFSFDSSQEYKLGEQKEGNLKLFVIEMK